MEFLEKSLMSFRSCFSRERTFKWFVILVLSFILRDDHNGVTSAIRTFALSPSNYNLLLWFFRSNGYVTENLRQCWYNLIKESPFLVKVSGRFVLIGDGVKQAKEGRRMPGVKKMSQESENSSKPEYIFGHQFGAIGVVVGNGIKMFCLPLVMNIQDGLKSTSQWAKSSYSDASQIVQTIIKGFEAARVIGKNYFLLDRYYLSVPALETLNSLNAGANEKLMDIVTKGKSNIVAYEKPQPVEKPKRGRPRKKGDKVHLSSLFEEVDKFEDAQVAIYGKKQTVSFLSRDLLWGQKLYQELRFVLVSMEDGKRSILVSTDTGLSEKEIIELYAHRFKIESCFREFKQQIGGFDYHFWTSALEKLKHFTKKGEPDPLTKITNKDKQRNILKAADAIERFVALACIAMGLVQLMALSVKDPVQVQKFRYLRTYTYGAISEATMMYFFRHVIFAILAWRPESFITRYIREAQALPWSENESK